MVIVARAFVEPATSWRAAFRRAATWSGPQLCGALAIEGLATRPWRDGLAIGLVLAAVPIGLILFYRSWRVGMASALVATAVVAAAMLLVAVWARLGGWGG
jgi:hypothetical protein